jgi:hypothetical protein
MSSEWPLVKLGDLTVNLDTKRKPVKEADRKSGPYPYYGASGIVDYVDPLPDDRIALLRETNATLEAIAQALFKSWFVDFDPVRAKQEGRAPKGWTKPPPRCFRMGSRNRNWGWCRGGGVCAQYQARIHHSERRRVVLLVGQS